MHHPSSKALYQHWNAMRAGRLAPRRFEIEPSAIAGILSDAFVLERCSAGSYRFRLAGTRICDHFGRELGGSPFIDLWPEQDRFVIEQQMALVAHGAAARATLMAQARSWGHVDLELLVLPLIHTHGKVDRYVGTLGALSTPDWLGYEPISLSGIRHHELIWPDGRPFTTLEPAPTQAPFLPHVRQARIVRQDRRQFRVYEGGLTKSGGEK